MSCLAAILITSLLFSSTVAPDADNSEAKLLRLRGPVRMVTTEYVSVDAGVESVTARIETVYDRDGFKVEETRFGQHGVFESRLALTRDKWRILKEVRTSNDSTGGRTVIHHFDPAGRVKRVETFDSQGALISEADYRFEKLQDSTTFHEHMTTPEGDTNRVTLERTDKSTGVTTQTAVHDGEQRSLWVIKRDAEGRPTADHLSFADGSFNKRIVKNDGTIVEHKFWEPTKTHTYQTTDANNRALEVIHESPNHYGRTAFKYDANGNEIEVANYDKAGILLRKVESDYLAVDVQGNWAEMRKHLSVLVGSQPVSKQLIERVRRQILYYE